MKPGDEQVGGVLDLVAQLAMPCSDTPSASTSVAVASASSFQIDVFENLAQPSDDHSSFVRAKAQS